MTRPSRVPSQLTLRLLIFVSVCVLTASCGRGNGGGGGDGGGGGNGGGGGSPGNEIDCTTWPRFTSLTSVGDSSEILAAADTGNCSVTIVGYQSSSSGDYADGDTSGFVRSLTLSRNDLLTEVWSELIQTPGTDAITSVRSSDDRLLFTGWTNAQLEGTISNGKSDVLVGAINRIGTQLKISQLGNQKPNQPVDLLDLPNGSRMLVGYDDAYIPTNFVETWEDPWLAGVTESSDQFVLDWLQNGNTVDQDAYTAATLADFLVVTALQTRSGPNRGIALEARNEAGQLVWLWTLSPSPYDQISDLHYLGNDHLLVFGTTYTAMGDSVPGGGDYFLSKLNLQSQQVLWVKQFGDGDINWARSMTVVGDRVFVAGESSPDSSAWSIDAYGFDSEGAEIGHFSERFGVNANVRQILPFSEGLLLVGSYQPTDSTRRGYVAFYRLEEFDGEG